MNTEEYHDKKSQSGVSGSEFKKPDLRVIRNPNSNWTEAKASSSTNAGGNKGGGDGGMESRIAVLEERTSNTDKNISDIKSSLRAVVSIGVVICLAIGSAYYSLNKDIHALEISMVTSNMNINDLQKRAGNIETKIEKIESKMDDGFKSLQMSIDKLAKEK